MRFNCSKSRVNHRWVPEEFINSRFIFVDFRADIIDGCFNVFLFSIFVSIKNYINDVVDPVVVFFLIFQTGLYEDRTRVANPPPDR